MSGSRARRSLGVAVVAVALAAGCSGESRTAPTGGPPADAPGNEVRLTEADSGARIALDLGDTVVIALVSNPSRGFAWTVVEPLPAQLAVAGEPVHVPSGGDEDMVGAAGVEEFTFEVVESGTGSLALEYVRSWEEGVPPEETFEVDVDVS